MDTVEPTKSAPARARTGTSGRRNDTRHKPRRWPSYAGVTLLAALLVAGFWPRPLAVETATASVGHLRATVNEEGRTRVRQRYVVSAPVAGQLRRIPHKPGAPVEAGRTLLAVIDPVAAPLLDARSRSLAEARRDTAAAQLEKARAAQSFAASELRRFEKLYAGKTVSIQELEQVQWRETAASRELAAAESALRQAEAELAEFTIPAAGPATANPTPTNLPPVEVCSPASGRVLRVLEESVRVVPAGTPLVEVGDPADLEAVIEVLSRDGAAIPPGTPVELEQWGNGAPLQARVRLVEPAAFTKVSALGVEEQRVNVVADIVTPPEKRGSLGDQFRVEARIIIWESDQALKVPSGALFRRGDDWAAFVVSGGRARLRTVKVGRSSNTETQILEGLQPGDEVIVYPGDRIRDGLRVRKVEI